MERILTTVFTAAIFLCGLVRGEDDAATSILPKPLVLDTAPTPTMDPNVKVVLLPGPTVTTTPSPTANKASLDSPADENIPLIIGLVVGISFLCILIMLGIWMILRRRRRQAVDGHKIPDEEWERGSYRESVRTLGGSRVGSRLGHVEISRPQMAMAVSVRSTRSLDSRLILVDGPGGGLGPLGTREVV